MDRPIEGWFTVPDFWFSSVLIAAFLLSGCGTTGVTTRSAVDVGALAASSFRPISVDSVAREEAGIKLMSVGVRAWGRFDDRDQANIKGSLEDTFAAATQGRTRPDGEPIKIHLVIRKYLVAGSNNEGAVLAGVDWCATDAKDAILFQESFYATHSVRFIGTLGGLKDTVNKAIVKRIAQSSLALAANERPIGAAVQYTYATLEQAAATMPDSLASWDQPRLVHIGPPRSAPEKVSLAWAEMRPPIDWKERLAAKQGERGDLGTRSLDPTAAVYTRQVVPFSDEKLIAQKILTECNLPMQLAEFLQAAASAKGLSVIRNDETVTAGKGLVLHVEIANALSGGSVFVGHFKQVDVSGRLLDDGKEIGSFFGRRTSIGNPLLPFSGSCSVLDRCLKALAGDIALWLKNPQKDARFGD